MAYQLEGISDYTNRKTWLLQLREFAKKEAANFTIKDPVHVDEQDYTFGITPETGLILPIERPGVLKNQGVVFLNPDNKKDYFRHMRLKPDRNIRGYIPRIKGKNFVLCHNNYRWVQSALRNNGFAFLGDKPFQTLSWKEKRGPRNKRMKRFEEEVQSRVYTCLQHQPLARFFCDGKNFRYERVDPKGFWDEYVQDLEFSWAEFLELIEQDY